MTSLLRSRRPVLSTRVLFLVALVGFGAAVAYALAPVKQQTHLFEFRPAATGQDPAIASLAIARSEPDALEVTLPCDTAGSQFRSMTLGNWMAPEGAERSPLAYQDLGIALQVGVGDGYAFMTLGGTEIFRLDVSHTPGCEVVAEFDGESWIFAAGDQELIGTAGSPRFSEALFDGPAVTSPVASVTVATRELGSSPSGLQVLLGIMAGAALALVGREIVARAKPTRREANSPLRRRLLRSLLPVDFAVGVGLVVWTFLIPAGFDDGWVVARQGAYDAHGAFSNLFDLDAAVLPLAYWVEWLQRFWLGLSSSSLVARIPVLGLALVTWAGLRSLLRSLRVTRTGAAPDWVLAAVFLVGWGAWNMTLRPEPIVAALLVASLLLALRFRDGDRGWVLLAWSGVIALAVTAHPAGVMVAAPLMASWKSVWVWVRSGIEARWLGAVTLLFVASLATMVFFLDSNLSTKLESIESLRAGGHDKSVLDEIVRYQFLGEAPYGAAMRRASVALAAFGVGIFIVGLAKRAGKRATPASRLPGWSLMTSLGLLALTPSKWSWHFGGLAGLAALVVALELERLRADRSSGDGRFEALRSATVVLGLATVASWTWRVSTNWTAFDLRTQEWWPGAINFLPVDLSSVGVWLGLAALVVVVAAVRYRISHRTSSTPTALTLVFAGLVIAVTASTLVLDVVRTDGWTFGRQNIESLWGAAACGLGDDIVVPRPGSLHSLDETAGSGLAADDAAAGAGFRSEGGFAAGGFPPIGVNGIRPDGFNAVRPLGGMDDVGSWLALDGSRGEANTGGYVSSWYSLGGVDSVALMVMGSVWDWDPSGNAIAVQWGRADGTEIADLGIVHVDISGYFIDWSLVSFERPTEANRVRVLLRDARSEGEQAWVASSTPLGFSTGSIADVAKDSEILVSPPLGLYLPCVDAPDFDRSVVAAPGVIVNLWRVAWQTTYAAAAASDRYFRVDVELDPPVRTPQIGAHLGDPDNFVFVSQEYLTGTPARVNGEFTLIDP